jgi:hypothetical protein
VAFLYNKLTRRLLLSLIIAWGIVSFWVISQATFARVLITILGVFSFVFVWLEIAPIFLLIFSSFSISYALYGFLFQYNLPNWLIMISILIIFGYLFVYTEQKIGILGNKRLVYLVLFSLIVLEVFLTLNYFLISPISKSLIIATISYLFVGFCYTVLAKHTDNKLSAYIYLAIAIVTLIFCTSIWGV